MYAQAHIDVGSIEKHLFVNNQHPKSSDLNLGSDPESPLHSLNKALEISKNTATKITVFPGHYREYLDIVSNQLLIIEASEPGSVYISGSDIFPSRKISDSLVFVLWPYNWGYFDDSDFCFGACNMSLIQKRRELLFINNQSYQQVLFLDSLKEGCFLVDEVNNQISIYPKKGLTYEEMEIEVSVRGYDIYDQGRNGSLVRATTHNGMGLFLRGLIFEHASNIAHQGCLSISNTDNLHIEDCVFQWNNGVGLELEDCSDVLIQNCTFRNNGERGMGIGNGENILLKDLKVHGNNWRMNAASMIAHDAAGIKVFGSTKNVILDNIHAYENYCNTIWFDWNNENYQILNSLIENNQESGIMLEGSRKQAYIHNCIIRHNNVGIKGYGHANVTVDSCYIYGNNAQISLGQDGRIVRQDNNWEINSKDWRIHYTKLIATDKNQSVLSFFEYNNPNIPSTYATEDFLETVEADYNTYFHPVDDKIFPDGKSVNGTPLSLFYWQSIAKQDKNSIFEKILPDKK